MTLPGQLLIAAVLTDVHVWVRNKIHSSRLQRSPSQDNTALQDISNLELAETVQNVYSHKIITKSSEAPPLTMADVVGHENLQPTSDFWAQVTQGICGLAACGHHLSTPRDICNITIDTVKTRCYACKGSGIYLRLLLLCRLPPHTMPGLVATHT